ncbi:1-phosphofructokinase family hexose kinase [Arthrobacter sp. UM1]|uniref:1-phosphofructokinase family hexose kinase n=1 Tax=Arthrobacter sp. UM1 TaxID=2766776 RepID=UPI001CF67E0C|nr:1-phosphofructokinase family hexose kinase [Arthrobacter sp. UM1]MCB4208849.1 1-phosphofructokinase family hexose kinase [Arthrobacter sp. UM1]
MIVTVTLNPSIDKTVELPGPLAEGRVQRAVRASQQPGGKGVNVAAALRLAGVEALALFPADEADPFTAEVRASGLAALPLPSGGPVRTNTALVAPDGTTTKVNEPGTPLSADLLEEAAQTVAAQARGAEWLVLAGSLPPGAPADLYAELIGRVREELGAPEPGNTGTGSRAPRIALDTSDEPLLAALAPDRPRHQRPDLVKPNGHELADLAGMPGEGDALEASPERAAEAARALTARGVGTVLATLGGNGAVLVTAEEGPAAAEEAPAAGGARPASEAPLDGGQTQAWHAIHAPVPVRSTVGAGDSALAGFLAASVEGRSPEDSLRRAVAYGSAAASLPGTTAPRPDQVTESAVVVAPIRPAHPHP